MQNESVSRLPNGIALRPEHLSQPLNTVAVAARLLRDGWHLDTTFSPRQFAGGLANLNYLIRLNDDWAVLRRPPSGPLPPGANDMGREHRILSALWRGLPLAPRSLYLCTDASVIGVPFQILEFRSGITLRGDSVHPLTPSPALGSVLSETLVATLAQIHSVDLEGLGLGTLGRPEGFFERQVNGWLGRAEHVLDGGLPPAARKIAEWLRTCAAPCDDRPVLLHSDFKLDNLMLDPDTFRATTVVDWDMGTRGPAMFDLATMLSYWTQADDPDCMHRLAQMPTALPGFMGREEVVAAYARVTGRDVSDIRSWRVLAILKLAVVFLQLHRRYVVGETTDSRYSSFGQLGNELFDFALAVAQEKLF